MPSTRTHLSNILPLALLVGALPGFFAGCAQPHRMTVAELVELERQLERKTPVALASEQVNLSDFNPYRTRVGDILQVQFHGMRTEDRWQSTQITLRVREDGAVTLPLVGKVTVADLTLAEAEEALINALVEANLYRDIAAYVTLADNESTTVLVQGAANSAGLVRLPQNERNPLYAIANAGGFTSAANGHVTVQPVNPTQPRITYNLNNINDVRRMLTAPPLRSGDVVVVDAAPLPAVFISGLVNAPGPINIPAGSTLSTLRAIAAAGGIRPFLTPDEAVLVRTLENGEQVQVAMNLKNIRDGRMTDVALKPGDVLHIPHTGETMLQEWFANNILVGPFSVGVRYDPLQQYNTDRAIDQTSESGFADSIRQQLSGSLPNLLIPPVTPQ